MYERTKANDGSVPGLEPNLCVLQPVGAGGSLISSHNVSYHPYDLQSESQIYIEIPLHGAAVKKFSTRTI